MANDLERAVIDFGSGLQSDRPLSWLTIWSEPSSTSVPGSRATGRSPHNPNEWASGDHLWLMAVAGDQRALPKFLEQLGETEFRGQRVKMRMRGPDGKVVVKVLGQSA